MADLKITALHKYYGLVHAVQGVDLEIPAGEFTVLVGQSGCGKSTLLRTIAGLEDADQGTIEIGGRGREPRAAARPRHRNGVPELRAVSVHDGVRQHRVRTARAQDAQGGDRAEGAARRADAGHRATARVAFRASCQAGSCSASPSAAAVVRNARLYLFDEPLSNLDAQLRDEMRGEIKRLHQELGKTMIYVTHDQIEAMTMADRIVLLRDGVIEQAGAPLDLYERPATRYVAGFLGSPAMNFVPARVVAGNGGARSAAAMAGPSCRCLRAGSKTGRTPGPADYPRCAARAHGRALPTICGPASCATRQRSSWCSRPGRAPMPRFKLGGAAVVAELQAHDVSQPGETIELAIDMNRVVLVDPATELVVA